jgi:hypothetical protein
MGAENGRDPGGREEVCAYVKSHNLGFNAPSCMFLWLSVKERPDPSTSDRRIKEFGLVEII